MIDEKKYGKIKNAIRKQGKKYNFSEEDVEDVAQEHFLHKSKPIKFLIIDSLRRDSGRKGTKHYTTRRDFRSLSDDKRSPIHLVQRNMGIDLEDGQIDHRLLKGLEKHEKATVLLTHLWNFDEKEIATLFGVSASRVSQWLAGIYNRLRVRINTEKARALQKIFSKKGCEMAQGEDHEMAQIQPREMVLDYETGFNQWLT